MEVKMKYLLEEKKEKVDYFEVVMRYIMEAREDLELAELIQIAGRVSVERSEQIMKIAEKLKMEGQREERYNIALNMLVDNLDIELIAKYTKLDEEKLEFMKEQIKNSDLVEIEKEVLSFKKEFE